MGFTHVQGTSAHETAATSWTLSLGSNPSTGNTVVVAVFIGNSVVPSSITVQDGNNNTYAASTHSPFDDHASSGGIYGFYYLVNAPANASKAITVTFGSGSPGGTLWLEEFGGGVAVFDKDATGNQTFAGTSFTGVSIIPTGSNELLYCFGSALGGNLTNPLADATQGVWTGAHGGIDALSGGDAEYVLSASGSTGCNFTDGQTGDTGGAILIAFTQQTGDVITTENSYQITVS